MQQIPQLFAGRRLMSALAAVLALLLLTGCEMTVTNLTPLTLPANPSHIYTISASFVPRQRGIIPESIQPRIIIDGRSFNMTKSGAAANVWEFDYQLPAGRTTASYYFICEYDVQSGSGAAPRDVYSELQTLAVAGRYVLRAEANRAPVGARVNILGAGFTAQDVVYLGNHPTRTVFESPAALSFFVPSVGAGVSYQLQVNGPSGPLDAGTFRVDATEVTVSPASLELVSGAQQDLTFILPSPAPAGGMLIEVTTDIAASIVMPEVMVPAGQTSATVTITGGQPGTGSLYYKTSAGESSIPVVVAPAAAK
ncbi:MAG TPA: cell surface protein [Opitutaceae bacterium]|nr:cell surface protein [Opitutaceae bacterium]